jgi:NADP-dependent 3-hydroxy acid dehydrogenase YdfG
VADEEQVREMIAFATATYGALHVLYNNAGVFPADDGGVTETPVPTWDRVMDVNLKGVWLGCKHGVPAMLESGGGSIVNVASFVGDGAATARSHTASKGGVLDDARSPLSAPGIGRTHRPGPIDTAARRGYDDPSGTPAPHPHPDGPAGRRNRRCLFLRPTTPT